MERDVQNWDEHSPVSTYKKLHSDRKYEHKQPLHDPCPVVHEKLESEPV
jgi:hypothetical protein